MLFTLRLVYMYALTYRFVLLLVYSIWRLFVFNIARRMHPALNHPKQRFGSRSLATFAVFAVLFMISFYFTFHTVVNNKRINKYYHQIKYHSKRTVFMIEKNNTNIKTIPCSYKEMWLNNRSCMFRTAMGTLLIFTHCSNILKYT